MDNMNITLPLLHVNSAHCAGRVEKTLHAIPALASAKVDLEQRMAILPKEVTAPQVREAVAAIRAAGYDVEMDYHRYTTSNITCTGCSNRATIMLNNLVGVIGVKIDHAPRTADLETIKGMLTEKELSDALRPGGYALLPLAA